MGKVHSCFRKNHEDTRPHALEVVFVFITRIRMVTTWDTVCLPLMSAETAATVLLTATATHGSMCAVAPDVARDETATETVLQRMAFFDRTFREKHVAAGAGYGDFARSPPDDIKSCHGFVRKLVQRLMSADFVALDGTKGGEDRMVKYGDVLRRALWSGTAPKHDVLMVLQDCFRNISCADELDFKSFLETMVRFPHSFVLSSITPFCPSLPQMRPHQHQCREGNSWLYFSLAVTTEEAERFTVLDGHLNDAWTMACMYLA